ncbi:MAG: multicopper oxidase family protein [Actinomycetota bacterium]
MEIDEGLGARKQRKPTHCEDCGVPLEDPAPNQRYCPDCLSRRDMLKLGVLGSAALMLPLERVARTTLALSKRIPEGRLPRPFTVPFASPPVLRPVRSTTTTDYYDLPLEVARAEILPGLDTQFWGYHGIFPGPTIKARRGRPSVVRQTNRLPSIHPTLRYRPWSSTHLHGSPSLPQYDGYASDVTNPGEYKDYHWANTPEGRTLWYHDHGVHHTAQNVYMGLAGQFLLSDDLEQSLPIPHGRYDLPLILQDAIFATDGSLVYDDNTESGVFGDVILVNGRPWPAMKVERRKYRFRVLNASVSRSFGLTLDSGEPMTVIGTDGGLMPNPQDVGYLRLGNAERYEVVIDFSKHRIGERVVLENQSPPNNIDYSTTNVVMAFEVVSERTSTRGNSIPDVLNPHSPIMKLDSSMATRTRRFEFERKHGLWTINGSTWAEVISSGYELVSANPGLNDVEIWELANPHGGWFHPVHIHLIDFQILDRNGRPPFAYEQGPKDVVYVGENETVRVLARFGPHNGRYMMHCHNLVHEDHDMMVQFQVGAGGDDPMTAAPAAPLPAPRL